MDVMEALVNMADVMAELWPMDDTPRILMRIVIHYKFAGGVRDGEADRCRIMAEFCDNVLRENASRAISRDPPLSFRQAKERWSDVVEKYGPVQHGKVAKGDGRAGNSGGGGQAAGGQQGAKGGAMVRGRAARYLLAGRSYAVCFDFNRGTCHRKPAGCGCEDAKGVVFAHVCNFWINAASRHCLAAHSRTGNH
jgi:hypothetical protein